MFSDLTQNSVEAGADIITVELGETGREVSFSIKDNGKGMTPEQLKSATDPFWTDGIKHPGRKVGLGIPFLIQTAEGCGGSWNIRSNKADEERGIPSGTVLEARFDLTNIDTPPVGDVTGYFRQILTFDGRYEMVITRKTPRLEYTVRRSELLDALGLGDEGSFTDAASLSLLGSYLESMEE
jgi:Signal transduction histidine kinase